VTRLSQSKYDDLLSGPLSVSPDNDIVAQVAESQGFQSEWLAAKAKHSGFIGIQLPITSVFARAQGAAPRPVAEPERQLQQQALGLTAVSKTSPPTPVPPTPVPVSDPRAQAPATAFAPPPTAPAVATAAATATAPEPAAAAGPTGLSAAMQLLGRLQPSELQQLMGQIGRLQLPPPPATVHPDNEPVQNVSVGGTAPPEAPDADAVDPNAHICAFCQFGISVANTVLPGEALACGHVFHAQCLADYMSATGKSKGACCPYKCAVSGADEAALMTSNSGAAASSSSSSSGESGPAPAPAPTNDDDDDDADLQSLVEEAAAAAADVS
jgi:hypothetical protein